MTSSARLTSSRKERPTEGLRLFIFTSFYYYFYYAANAYHNFYNSFFEVNKVYMTAGIAEADR
jgi:hypothetical protein